MRFKVIFNRNNCKGCELCASVCPKKIISLDRATVNAKGYHTAYVADMSLCIGCASCAKICPDSIISIEKEE